LETSFAKFRSLQPAAGLMARPEARYVATQVGGAEFLAEDLDAELIEALGITQYLYILERTCIYLAGSINPWGASIPFVRCIGLFVGFQCLQHLIA